MKKVDTFQKFWFLGLIPTVVSMWVLVNTQCFKVANLLEIEFANNFHVFSILIKKHDQMVLVNNHMFDFFFILCYSVLFILSLKLISLALDFHFKTRVYLICLIPGLLDVLENILFLGLVQDCSYFFEAYFWSVRIKWGSAVIFIQLIMAILLFYFMLNSYRFVAKLLVFLRKIKL